MGAPDKIYIRPMPNPSDGYVGIAWDKPIPMCETYIRKDALLEWAKINSISATGYGEVISTKCFVDKLNSM